MKSKRCLSLRVARAGLLRAAGRAAPIIALVGVGWAGNLTLTEAAAVDGFGMARTRFSKTERVGGRVQGVAREAGETISYEFVIKDPAGTERGRWTGNSGVGSAGVFGAQISGVAIDSI